ncbi:hypothetical protein CC79DRAFT_1371057 [Sarocladium strictum]
MSTRRSSARLASSKPLPIAEEISPKAKVSPAPIAATTTDLPIIHFSSASAFSSWLSTNHSTSPGLFLKISKKSSNIPSATYDTALDVALTWGWIDGQRRTCPDDPGRFFLQRFTKRRKGSNWSKRNVEKVGKLTEEGRMMKEGLEEVERAKADGRWERAYAGQKDMEVPQDLSKALEENRKAKEVFESLQKSKRFVLLMRLETAKKTETRAARVDKLVTMLADGKIS